MHGVLIVDDHGLMRAGLRALISGFADFEVVGEAADGREAVRLARELKPRVVLMDLSMAGLNGLDATAQVYRDVPGAEVLVLSMHTAENYVREALRAGAAGYVVKDAAVDELELALRAVVRGERYLSPSVSRVLMDDYLRLSRSEGDPEARSGVSLTPRQREILQLIAEGRSTRQIGQQLGVSVKTVEAHRAQLMARLGIYDVAGLTRYAMRIGITQAND
jgi:DNA-binding NarL/FixJ family response regulator